SIAAAGTVTVLGSLWPACCGDAAQRAERIRSLADVAAERRTGQARQRLLQEAGAREGDVPRSADDSVLSRPLGRAPIGRKAAADDARKSHAARSAPSIHTC